MAVSSTFKQQCPSCEAMISIKENMIGKKVECTKCKDKFLAERPDAEEKDAAAKNKKSAVKKAPSTAVAGKPAAGKAAKKIDDEGDEKPPTKAGKSKAAANGKPAPKSAKEDDDDDDDKPAQKKDKTRSNKLVIGLGLAVVGVLLLVVFAIFVLPEVFTTKGGSGTKGGFKAPQGGGPKPNEGDKTNTPIIPVDPGPQTPKTIPLDEKELARLSNLLPNDSEHVFHAFFRDLFGAKTALREAGVLHDSVFETPGALDDAAFLTRLGFSVQAIDDLIVAEKYTSPSWKYTVIHFNEAINEDRLKAALKLDAVKLDGKVCYKTQPGRPAPWLDQLGRFSFGVPVNFRYRDDRARDQGSYFRVHNAQTLVIGDEKPMKDLVAGIKPLTEKQPPPMPILPGPKGALNFKPVDLARAEQPNRAPASDVPAPEAVFFTQANTPPPFKLAGTTWEGTEDGTFKLRFTFDDKGGLTIDSPKTMVKDASAPSFEQTGNDLKINSPSTKPAIVYKVTIDPSGKSMSGKAEPLQRPTWPVKLELVGGTITPNDPNPPPVGAGDDMYLTIKRELKAVLDRMEVRPDGKGKVLFSSATDMSAAVQNVDRADVVVRRPRQFWDVTLLLNEPRARIRALGTSLHQKDTLRFQLRNELLCNQDSDANEIQKEMIDTTSSKVANFIRTLTRHDVKLPLPEKKDAASAPPPPPDPKQPDPKKKPEASTSRISVNQQSNTVEFVLDLVLNGQEFGRVQDIASMAAAAVRVKMEAASQPSLRHLLGLAGRKLGENGLPEREIPPGRFPPGAFPRDARTTLLTDREPGNRISWMAGLLPYMGHEALFKKIQFNQSWRDPGNWMAGNTAVPQFLDPMYPDHARYAHVKDVPIDFAATHYVGIAGVGMDAASYRDDPATDHRRGILSYEGSAGIDKIKAGRGLSNAILMIQVPHDGDTGVSPWMAGGGATLRGVPEKNSIAPFVLSTDRNGKTINQQNKRGTYAVMADGSVRFIDQNVSDEVFQAMCTIGKVTPKDFDLDKNPNTPLMPPPADKEKAKGKPADKGKPPPVDKGPAKKPADKAPEQKVGKAVPAKEVNEISVAQQSLDPVLYFFEANKNSVHHSGVV